MLLFCDEKRRSPECHCWSDDARFHDRLMKSSRSSVDREVRLFVLDLNR